MIISTGAYGSLRTSSVLRVDLTVEDYDGSERYDDSEPRVERRFALSETRCSGVSVTVITASLTSDDPRHQRDIQAATPRASSPNASPAAT